MPVDFEIGVNDSVRLSVEEIAGERGHGTLLLEGPEPFWTPVLQRLEETYHVDVSGQKVVKHEELPRKGASSRGIVVASLNQDYDVVEGRVTLRLRG